MKLILLLIVCLCYLDKLCYSQSTGPTVKTHLGLIKGIKQSIDGIEINSYLGIPYALPPVGPRRFQKTIGLSKPFTDNDGVYQADSFGAACEQNLYEAAENTPCFTLTENCLYLNIWSPANASSVKLYPVLVHIHGSNFTFGSSGAEDARCDYLTAYTNIVTVNMNYRLGALGFAYGGNDQIIGNQAVHDVITSFDWIKSNIRSFGGDPDHITLSGLSAGSIILSAIFMTPTVPVNWFNRLFFMSGFAIEHVTVKSSTSTLKLTKSLSKSLNCSHYSTSNDTFNVDEIVCLKLTSGLGIAQTKENDGYQMVYGDEYILPIRPRELINLRKFPKGFKIMVGTETNEGYLGKNIKAKTVPEAIYKLSAFLKKLGVTDSIADGEGLVQRYFTGVSPFDEGEIEKRKVAFLSNLEFQCPSLLYSVAFSQDKGNTVYFYRNNYVTSSGRSEGRPFGAKHADDFTMFTGTPFRHPNRFDDNDRKVSRFMMNVLADFVKGKDPFWSPIQVNASSSSEISLPRWDIKNNATLTNVEFDTDKDICLIWAKYFKLYV